MSASLTDVPYHQLLIVVLDLLLGNSFCLVILLAFATTGEGHLIGVYNAPGVGEAVDALLQEFRAPKTRMVNVKVSTRDASQ